MATVLEYRSVPPAGSTSARWIRIGMVIAAILAIHLAAILILNPLFAIHPALGGGAMGTPLAPIYTVDRDDARLWYIPKALIYLAMFLVMQWWFLTPRGSWKVRTSLDGPPPRRSAIAAGFIGMLLSIGLIAVIMEIPDWWIALTTEGKINTPQHFGVVWIVMAILWLGWTIVFAVYWRNMDRYTALGRVFRRLLAGTILELVIAAPAHAVIVSRRGSECYCERGTWTGVAFGCTAALWLFGPGAFLLFLRERRRRENLI